MTSIIRTENSLICGKIQFDNYVILVFITVVAIYCTSHSMKKYIIKSPAKINIGLRVLSRRKDGYHNIETIFYPIKLHDNIIVKINPSIKTKISVKVTGKKNKLYLNGKNNICYQAVSLFLERFGIIGNFDIKIIIRKNIPVGAGLGGGSSNAASVLKVLAKHFNFNYSSSTGKVSQLLQKLALELGSDVPFFLIGKPAYAAGRGEKLIPLPEFKVNYRILIANPGIHVSTAWAYKQLRIKNYELRNKKHLSKIKTFSITHEGKFINDFERVVFRKYPAIKKLKQEMYIKGAVFATMSGSGSTVYGFFKNKKK